MLRSAMSTALAFCALTFVSSAPAAAQVKVGVINLQKAVLETADIKKAQREMELKYKPRQDALEKLQREMADIQTQMQSSAGKLSASGEADLQAQGAKKQREAQRLNDDLQADVERDRNDILQRVGSRMSELVKKLAEEKGLDMVVDTTSVIFSKPALEITDAAIAAYDKAYPAK
jgi:outer membrane protein